MPHDRSMPAVRMISVWPIAMTPTTAICCRISEKFSPLKKRSVAMPKNTQAISKAMKGPSWPMGGNLSFMRSLSRRWRQAQTVPSPQPSPADAGEGEGEGEHRPYFLPQHSPVPVFTSLLSTPGIGLAAISVTPVSV